MSLELSLSNLWFYSLQTGILILAAGLLVRLFRLREPRGLCLFWRVLLAVCLLLVLQPGVPDSLSGPVSVPTLAEGMILPASPVTVSETDQAADVVSMLGVLLASGILLRLIWLGAGFYRLRRLRRRTRRLVLPPHLQPLTWEMRVSARFGVSSEVTGPITFGWLRPVIVFPDSFVELDPAMQKAVACHELLHVKRGDWIWNTIEELVRTVFWFHPGIYWLIGRIQLTREQVVDEQAVALLGSRKTYLHSLVEIARWKNSAASLPAALFLRECQFIRRVRHLLQLREVRMSKTKSTVFWSVCVALLLATGWWSLAALPLTASPSARMPQEEPVVQKPVRVGSRVMANKLVHKVDPEIPGHPGGSRPLAQFILSIVIDKDGGVQQVQVLQGDEDHLPSNSAVTDAVKQWRYEPFLLDGKPTPVRTTVFLFLPRAEPAGTTGSRASPRPEAPFDEPIHVGQNVMANRLIHRVDPETPSGLESDHPLGVVILSVVVDRNGKVQEVTVVRGDKGDPGLNSAAVKAVRQWRYKPFVLDGIPVPVRTTVVVRFPRDTFRPQSVNLKSKTRPQIRHQLERARKELDRARSEMAAIDMKEFRRRLEGVRKKLEGARSKIARIDIKELQHRFERAQKEMDRAISEMAVIDMNELQRKLRELEEMIERGE